MRKPSVRGHDRLLFPALVALILLLSPAVRVWAGPDSPWWMLFALWGLLIAIIGWSGAREGGADDGGR